MILDEITLYNFGLYFGRQTITLTPTSSRKPIVLLGGLNGSGKTTLLDALQLCLFGPFAKISNRGPLAYNEYLSRSIHRGVENAEAAIAITFRHTNEGHEDKYSLRRFWHRANGSCKECFVVWKNGRCEPALAENWVTEVEEFVPPNIAHLFLFDAEQIEGYVSYEHSSELIGTAIQNLLGLDIVEQLEKDLLVYERRKRFENRNDAALAEIKVAETELRELRSKASRLNLERASLQTHRIDPAKRALARVEEEYSRLGGHLFDQRLEIERRLKEAEKLGSENEEAQRDLAAGVLPLLLVRPLLESAHVRDRQEEESRRAREFSDELQSRDHATLIHLRNQLIDKDTVELLKSFFREDREKWRALGKKHSVLDLAPGVRSDLQGLLRGDLEGAEAVAHKQLRLQETQGAAIESARVEFESIPTADTISEVSARRYELKDELAHLEMQHSAISREIDRVYKQIEWKEKTLIRLNEADAKGMTDRDDRARVLRHAAKVRQTLSIFRNTVVERHIRRIEWLVLESYTQLLQKGSLVTHLSINPENFTITLYGRDGEALTPERLSAGERQLLGISLLWGLAKASGRPLPAAIDTPLGRLDAGHRMHFVERYLPFASHQVLLLSTNEEIAGEYLNRLKPWIGRSYYLNYDDNTAKTQVVPGYFEEARRG